MNYSKYSEEIIQEILGKIESGKSKLSLSKEYKIPRCTIKYWCDNKNIQIKEDINIKNVDNKVYSYILGLYLGDGYINKMLRTYRLRITLDSRQDLIINETIENLKMLFPNNKINTIKRKNKNCVDVSVYSNYLLELFTQSDNGRKHNRQLNLTNEQKNILDYNYLMKGLFHSDGSFFIATNKYPRYQFTNKSKDLIDIFSDCLNRININSKYRTRKSGIMDIQIQNKTDVIKLYPILGEKYFQKKVNKNLDLI